MLGLVVRIRGRAGDNPVTYLPGGLALVLIVKISQNPFLDYHGQYGAVVEAGRDADLDVLRCWGAVLWVQGGDEG